MRTLRILLANLEEIVACAFLLVMSCATFVNVIARYFFNAPLPWAEELARYSFLWLVFTGAAVCTKHRRHIAIDVVIKLLPRRMQICCEMLANVCIILLMAVLVYYGIVLTASANQPTSTLGIPTYFIYVAVPISATSILIRTLIDFLRDIANITRVAR